MNRIVGRSDLSDHFQKMGAGPLETHGHPVGPSLCSLKIEVVQSHLGSSLDYPDTAPIQGPQPVQAYTLLADNNDHEPPVDAHLDECEDPQPAQVADYCTNWRMLELKDT